MTPEQRLAAAEAFWREGEEEGGVHEQHVEAVLTIARRLNFRPKSVQALSIDRRAKQLAHLPDVSDAVATRALIAYHLAHQRPMMGAFLDALGIAHENGLIPTETVPAQDPAKLKAAAESLSAGFPPADVELYLKTLVTQDPDTWGGLAKLPQLAF
jgi:hypothetical protein